MSLAACPTPHKHGWSTKSGAKRSLRLHGMKWLQAYRCRCGRWHVAHKTPRRRAA